MSPADHLARALAAALSEVSEPRLGVAVSGGGDSVALMALLAEWALPRGVTIEVASVDHGLRSEAAEEVALVARHAKTFSLSHARLSDPTWQVQGNLQAAARDLRLTLLRDWAIAKGLTHICLGHTLDDQAETLLLRLSRGSGVDGLAGMSDARQDTKAPLIWLRPLLGVRREALREDLTARGLAWADDPSNQDTQFDRVRARKLMERLADLGLSAETLSETATRMAAARTVLGQQAIDVAVDLARLEAGEVLFEQEKFLTLPQDTVWRLFAAALCWVSGESYRPRFSALRRALDEIAQGRRTTLHGCLCYFRQDTLHIGREPAAVAPPMSLTGLWDNRWKIEAPPDQGLLVGALGEAGLAERPKWRNSGLPREAFLASPALWQGPRLYAALLLDKSAKYRAIFARGNADFNALLLPD